MFREITGSAQVTITFDQLSAEYDPGAGESIIEGLERALGVWFATADEFEVQVSGPNFGTHKLTVDKNYAA